jgi:mRNA interferase RelE/StbE
MKSYKVRIDDKALKQLKKFDKVQARLISGWIDKNLEGCSDPRAFGKALSGSLRGYWRYHIGSYRLIACIKGDIVTIVIIDIDHRSNIYR